MDLSALLDYQHGPIALVLSVFAILFLQLLVKIINLYMREMVKKQDKRNLDMRRAFKAIRILSGDKWPEIRNEIMSDEKMD